MLKVLSRGGLAAAALSSLAPCQHDDALARIPAGYRNVIHVTDIAPAVRAALRAEGLDGVVEGFGMSARNLQQQFGLLEGYVPTSTLIAWPTGTARSIAMLARGVLAANLVWGLHSTENLEPIPDMQREVLDAIAALMDARFHVEIETRSPRMAEQWFDSVASNFESMADEIPGASVRWDGDSVAVTVAIPAEVIDPFLIDLGAALGPNDRWLEQVHGTLARQPLRIEAALEDGCLIIALGERSDGRLAVADLRPMTVASQPGSLAVAQWDLRPMMAQFRSTARLWRQWKDTKVGAFLRNYDPEDFYGSVLDLERQADSLPASGAAHIATGEQSLEMVLQEDQPLGFEPLAKTAFASIAPEAAVVVASGDRFGDRLVNYLRQLEDQMATRQLQADLRGDVERAQQFQRVLDVYYQDLATTRTLLVDRGRDLFGSGWLAIADLGMATVAPPDAPASEGFTKKTPGLAAMAVVADGISPGEVLDRLFGAMAADLEIEPSRCRGDLGLDRDVHMLPEDVWGQARIRGDLQFHGFALDDVVVLSTAPSLSRRLIEAAASGRPAPWAQDETMVASWAVSGTVARDGIAAVEDWFGEFTTNGDQVFDMLYGLSDLFEAFTSESTRSARGIRTTARLRFGG